MKKINNNLYYFNISKKSPEKFLDEFYIFKSKHPDLEKYINRTKEIKDLLITIKTLKQKNEKKSIIKKYFYNLASLLSDFSNCSEFSCFVNACDSFLDEARDDIVLLEKIVDFYFENRVLKESVPEEWIQAILDNNSSKKESKCGEKKLMNILSKYGFKKVSKWDDFLSKNKCFIEFSKNISMNDVRGNLNINLATKKQNKKLDIIIKKDKNIFLCEAKHLNSSGGEQDKQISELIEIIGLKERDTNIHYISFLDGSYSNILLGDEGRGDKLLRQRKEIEKNLKNNKNNYWMNTMGFTNFIKDIK